jgi:hypothetical protein
MAVQALRTARPRVPRGLLPTAPRVLAPLALSAVLLLLLAGAPRCAGFLHGQPEPGEPEAPAASARAMRCRYMGRLGLWVVAPGRQSARAPVCVYGQEV